MRTMQEIPIEYCADIRESANRPQLVAGCEPDLFAVAVGVFILPIFALMTTHLFKGIFLGAVLSMLCFQVFRAIARYDPAWMKIKRDAKNWKQGYWPAHYQPPRMPYVLPKGRPRARNKLLRSSRLFRAA